MHFFSAAAFAFLTTMSLMPVLLFERKFGDKAFCILVWSSMALSALSFLFMVGIASVAKYNFEKNGFTASFGNLVSPHTVPFSHLPTPFRNFQFQTSLERKLTTHTHSILCHLRRLYCCFWPLSAHFWFRLGRSREHDLALVGVIIGLAVILKLDLPRRDGERYRENLWKRNRVNKRGVLFWLFYFCICCCKGTSKHSGL